MKNQLIHRKYEIYLSKKQNYISIEMSDSSSIARSAEESFAAFTDFLPRITPARIRNLRQMQASIVEGFKLKNCTTWYKIV